MPRKPDAGAELREKLIAQLEARRQQGPAAYPVTLRQLVELADPAAPPALVEKVVAGKPFAARVLVAQKKNGVAPVALVEDADRLADSPMVLEFVLNSVCTPNKPAWTVAQLKTKVIGPLKQPFADAVQRHIEADSLPPSVGCLRDRKPPVLFLHRMPPPKPPAVEWAEKLVAILEAQRPLGPAAYPPTLPQLVGLAGVPAPTATLKKAVGLEPFRSRVVVAIKSSLNGPLALTTDLDRLAASATLLNALIDLVHRPDHQAFHVNDFKAKLNPALWPAFQEAVQRQIGTATLPAGIGCILIKAKPHLLLVRDVGMSPERIPAQAPPLVLPAPPADFEPAFDAAFARLDREQGGHNFVNLVGLRQALASFDRREFDAELRRLRLAQRYTLSAAEGRHGVSAEEQAAAVVEDGALLLYVSRR